MYIQFKSLEAKNCLSYENLRLDFQNGITVIDGWNEDGNTANAAGKSSIADILVWTIYGRMPRDLSIPEILRSGADSGESTIEFSDECNNNYKIIRQINPNELAFYQNNIQISKENKLALQSYIIGLIGINYDIFVRTIYLPQNFGSKFLMMTDESRKDLLFRIVNLDFIDRVHATVNVDLGVIKEKLSVAETELRTKAQHINDTRMLVEAYKNKADDFSKEKAKDLEGMDKEILSVDESVRNIVVDINKLKDDSKDIKRIDDIKSKIKYREDKLARINELREERNAGMVTLKRLEDERDKLEDELANLESQDAPCPYCRRSLSNEMVESRKPIVVHLLEINADKIKVISKELVDKEKVIAEYKPKLEKELLELNQELNLRSDYQSRMSGMEDKRQLLVERLMSLRGQRGKMLSAENVYMSLMSSTKSKIKEMLDDLTMMQSNVDVLVEEQKLLTQLKKIFGPQGFKSLILDGLINELNMSVREYLDVLYDQSVEIKFDVVQYVSKTGQTESYKLPVTIKVDGKEWPFNALSGGEKRRAVLAVDLALSKIVSRRYGNGCNILMMDEVTNDLDEHSREKFYNLLQSMAVDDKGLYLIDHSVEKNLLKDAKIIRVVKSNGVSRIVG